MAGGRKKGSGRAGGGAAMAGLLGGAQDLLELSIPKALEAVGLHDDAARAAIKGALAACERHGFKDAAAKLREALPLVPRLG